MASSNRKSIAVLQYNDFVNEVSDEINNFLEVKLIGIKDPGLKMLLKSRIIMRGYTRMYSFHSMASESAESKIELQTEKQDD